MTFGRVASDSNQVNLRVTTQNGDVFKNFDVDRILNPNFLPSKKIINKKREHNSFFSVWQNRAIEEKIKKWPQQVMVTMVFDPKP